MLPGELIIVVGRLQFDQNDLHYGLMSRLDFARLLSRRLAG
jgi:hypothetical protein